MIQSVKRAAQILRCFEGQELLGVTEIAELTKLNKSTAFGLITTLASEGLLEQDNVTGRYRLGLELFRLGSLVNTDTRRLVMPELTELTAALKETLNFVRHEKGDVVYLIKKESPHSMRICTKTGQRLPMYCTAVGKAILAYLPEEERDQIIADFEFKPFTQNTVQSGEMLLAQLEEIRRNGYAIEREELEYELVCVAVPVLNRIGYPAAAISCSGPKSRMTEEKLLECRLALSACARRLSAIIPF